MSTVACVARRGTSIGRLICCTPGTLPQIVVPDDSDVLDGWDEGIGSITKPAQPTGTSGSLESGEDDWKSDLGVGEGRVDGIREDLGFVEPAREGGTECRGDGVGVALAEVIVEEVTLETKLDEDV